MIGHMFVIIFDEIARVEGAVIIFELFAPVEIDGGDTHPAGLYRERVLTARVLIICYVFFPQDGTKKRTVSPRGQTSHQIHVILVYVSVAGLL